MVEFEDTKQQPTKIQWTDVDIEASGPHRLRRRDSNISIHSVHSRRGSIDPASALPIQYRTISYQIAESKELNAGKAQKAKENAAKGKPSSLAMLHSCLRHHRS